MEFTAEQLGADHIARELAYFCVISSNKYFERCDELNGVERRRCKNRVSFALYCIKRTDLVVELPGDVLVLIPCILTLAHRYGYRKIVWRRITELQSESDRPVKLSVEDVRVAIRQAKKSPLYFILDKYAEKVALSSHLAGEALRLIKTLSSISQCKVVSTLLLSYIIATLSTMTLQKTPQALDDTAYNLARTCFHSLRTHSYLRKTAMDHDINVLLVLSDVLHNFMNNLLEVNFLSRRLAIVLRNEVYSKYIDTTPSRQRFAKYMANKLLQYNAFMRICTELKHGLDFTNVG